MIRRFSLSTCTFLAGLGLAGTAEAAVGVHLQKGAGSGLLFGKSLVASKPQTEQCALAPAAGPIAFASPPLLDQQIIGDSGRQPQQAG